MAVVSSCPKDADPATQMLSATQKGLRAPILFLLTGHAHTCDHAQKGMVSTTGVGGEGWMYHCRGFD